MPSALRIIFAGTPDFSVPALQALLDAGEQVIGVYTQPDRPAGRGRRLAASPVKQLAEAAALPVYQPPNFKDEDDLAELEALRADLMVVVAYGLLLPQRVLDAPRLGCVNIHASLLPRWRGAAPIQRAILAGDTRTGVAIMRMEAGLDTGPVYLVRETRIGERETAAELHDRLAHLGAEALMAALPGIADGSLAPVPQEDADAPYARKLDKAEARIDWTLSAAEIDRRVRAFNAWPVAFTHLDRQSLRIWEAETVPDTSQAPPGTVVAQTRAGIDVATGDGVLRILKLQLPGKRATGAREFLNARRISGARLD
ncbi:MAG: methionyl-tRNA formyltransferase [Pseudomonadota bacterium]